MTANPEIAEVLELAALECDGQATPEQMARLEALLALSPAPRRRYLHYVFLHAHLATSDDSLRGAATADVLATLTAAMPASHRGASVSRVTRTSAQPQRWSRWSAGIV